MPRGPSKAVQAAEKYLQKNPSTPADVLAEKFHIDVTTVYRAAWWKESQRRLSDGKR